jgi:hypothetical protein
MLARRFLRLGAVFVDYANDFEAGLFVSREVRVIHDSTRTNNSDSLI